MPTSPKGCVRALTKRSTPRSAAGATGCASGPRGSDPWPEPASPDARVLHHRHRRPGADLHLAAADHHRRAADADRGDLAIGLVRLDLEDARPPHLESLLNDPAQRAVLERVTRREIAA